MEIYSVSYIQLLHLHRGSHRLSCDSLELLQADMRGCLGELPSLSLSSSVSGFGSHMVFLLGSFFPSPAVSHFS